jgi:Ca2+-binding EF-hand superfamily protein
MEMRAIAKLELSASALHEIADGFERTASSNQAMAGSRESLHVALGTRLMEKADKKGGQAFFRELDVNGDGSVTRIEFKQMMRKLGLLGEGSSFDAKAVDDLFSELDADGGGELDLGEILAALKKLKARVLAVERQEAVAQAEADNWRARAEQTRRAAERVAEKEVIASELHELRFNPSVEWRLATLHSKAQLKPAEVLTKFDGNTDGKIDKGEFAEGFLSLRIDATVEELHELHGKLDTVRRHARALSRSRGLPSVSAAVVPVRVASPCAHAPSTTAMP